jgi:hypothetical protein
MASAALSHRVEKLVGYQSGRRLHGVDPGNPYSFSQSLLRQVARPRKGVHENQRQDAYAGRR